MADSTPLRIAVLDDYQGIAGTVDWSPVPRPVLITSLREHIAPDEGLAEALAGYEVVVAMRERTPIDAALLARLPALKLLVTTGPFNAAIDVAAAHRLGITVSGTGGAITPTVEHTWALILGLQRHVVTEDQRIRHGRWQGTIGTDLAGATLGLVGVGPDWPPGGRHRQGVRDERDRVEPPPHRRARGRSRRHPRGRQGLFADADVVSVHTMLTEATRGLVGQAELAAMTPSAILVNTSRGGLIDEPALIAALRGNRIRGAALDVFQQEPLPPGHPLAALSNTLLTPHLGYVTAGVMEIFYRDIVEDVAAYCAGSPIRLLTP